MFLCLESESGYKHTELLWNSITVLGHLFSEFWVKGPMTGCTLHSAGLHLQSGFIFTLLSNFHVFFNVLLPLFYMNFKQLSWRVTKEELLTLRN